MQKVRSLAGVGDGDPAWILDDASFEKMGALMNCNASRLLGLYDEFSAFLSQINLYKGRNLSDSHELALFCNCSTVIHGEEIQVCLVNQKYCVLYPCCSVVLQTITPLDGVSMDQTN